ncbi:MAG: hypothetical protein IJ607_09420 [Bacteroidaceae bacterium]|nr:hypothetical protein [Bacteroidaceae bacterium]
MKKICYLMSLFLLCLWGAGIGNVSAQQTYVKWKLVDWLSVIAGNNDVVVIVDRTTGMALSNDKEDEDPDAVAVELNYDKDRILGDVPENVQWTFTGNPGSFQFASGENNLYADSKGLKVGSESNNCMFDLGSVDADSYLHIKINDKDYFAGVEKSMFTNSWKLKEVKDGKPDDVVKDTRFAIFKKVEDTQKVITLSFPYKDYEFDENQRNYTGGPINFDKATPNPAAPDGGGSYNLYYKSSNFEVAFPVNPNNPDNNDPYGEKLRVKKSGTTQIVATISETEEYDKAQAVFTLRIYNSGLNKGTEDNPFTVKEAIKLAKGEETYGIGYEEGRCYFIKGIVNKVNNGMLSMFGDMGLDEIMGDDMDMEERMGDMDDFDMSEMGEMMGGMDLASLIPGFGPSEGVDYYISDDGTKDNRIKVVKGRGLFSLVAGSVIDYNGPEPTAIRKFAKLEDLSPGDEVLVFGPLEVSEDTNMFASLMGNSGNGQNTQNDDEQEDKKTVKVAELNYLYDQTKMLLVKDQHLYNSDNYTKHIPEDNDFFFTLNGTPNGAVQPAQVKSADEEIAKWVIENEDNEQLKDSLFTPLNPGHTKVTTKVKVVVHEKDPNDEDSKEKYYTMKRKFNLEVRPIDKDPEGKNVGEYVLVKNVEELNDEEASRRLLIVGTRVKEGETNEEGTTEDEITNYLLGTEDAMMGGGKGTKKIDNDKITINDDNRECIKYEDVPEKTQEIILEKKDDTHWYLKVGKDENDAALYLYASDYKEEDNEQSDDPEGQQGQGTFNMNEMMEMFSPSSGLKIGTLEGTKDKTTEGQTTEAAVDSCMATISISTDDIAIISYPKTEGKKNTVVLTSSFDLEGIMNMFGGNEEEEDDEQQTEEESSNGMNFDFFMGAFNSVKADDEKGMKPRIFMFKQYDQYPITIGETEWMTFVSDYDVEAPDNVEAYVVTRVVPGTTQCMAALKFVGPVLKGGVPYLLHAPKGTYTMTRDDSEPEAPAVNKLQISDSETGGYKTGSSVYVLGQKNNGVGFYRWTGHKLGAGRVYLSHVPEPDVPVSAREFISFGEDNPTDISSMLMDEQEKTVTYYNLSGQRVDKPLMKGVYITNGKKILVK